MRNQNKIISKNVYNYSRFKTLCTKIFITLNHQY